MKRFWSFSKVQLCREKNSLTKNTGSTAIPLYAVGRNDKTVLTEAMVQQSYFLARALYAGYNVRRAYDSAKTVSAYEYVIKMKALIQSSR